MITLKQLRYFDAVAQCGHFGQAADHCRVTQPALSMQVLELEKTLGVSLIERRHRQLILTDAGREIERRTRGILSQVRDLSDYARSLGGALTGVLRLGVIPSLAPYTLPPLLPLIQARYPDLDLRIRETQTDTLVGELLEGTLDVLLLALPIEHRDIDTIALFDDRFHLAVPPGREITEPVQTTPELLATDRLLLLEEGHCLRDQALSFCQLRQVDHIDTFGASSLSTIVQMVASGLGMTLLPESCIDLEVRDDRVKLLRFADPEPFRTVGLAWRATSPLKDEFAEFGNLVKKAVPHLIGDGEPQGNEAINRLD